jgi:hypothetical protein
VVEDNKTHVGVYVNHISSCNFNHNTLEVICVNDAHDTLIQYSNVKAIAMCDYHYCMRFHGDDHKVICTGYTWTHGRHAYNPLTTPDASATSTTSNSTELRSAFEAVDVGDWFLGWNIQVDQFVQNYASLYDNEVKAVVCGPEPYTTCVVTESNGTDVKSCAGMVGVTLRDQVGSLFLGVNLLALISGVQYVPLRYLFPVLRESLVFNMVVVPCFSVVLSMVLLVVAQNFVVKMAMFLIGAFLGVTGGYILSEVALRMTMCLVGDNRVSAEAEAESTSMLRSEPSKFVIEDNGGDEEGGGGDLEDVDLGDGGETTIELGQITSGTPPRRIVEEIDHVRRI